MKKAVKYIPLTGCLLMIAFLVLYSVTKLTTLAYIAFAVGILTIALWVIFGRCPGCGRFLGRATVQRCPYCGKRIEW